MAVQWFILMKTIVFQGYRGLPSFSKGSFEFFSGAGVKMLISIETYITYDLSGGGVQTLSHLRSAHALI